MAFKFARREWPPRNSLDKERQTYYLHERTGVRIERRRFSGLHGQGWLWKIDIPVEGPVTAHNWERGDRWVYEAISDNAGWTKAEAVELAQPIIQEINARRYREQK